MKILISGSRDWDWYSVFEKAMIDVVSELQNRHLVANSRIEVVQGGARGVDAMALQFANKFGMLHKTFVAEWKNMKAERVRVGISKKGGYEYNTLAGFNRNLKMLEYINSPTGSGNVANRYLVAFQQDKSRGTQDMIDTCKKYEIPSYVFTVKYGVQLKLATFNTTSQWTRSYS